MCIINPFPSCLLTFCIVVFVYKVVYLPYNRFMVHDLSVFQVVFNHKQV